MAAVLKTFATLQELQDGISAIESEQNVKFIGQVVTKNFGSDEWKDRIEKKEIQWENTLFRLAGQSGFDGIPFVVIGRRMLECSYGPDHYSSKRKKLQELRKMEEASGAPVKYHRKKELKKKYCPAKIKLQEVLKFPKFAIPDNKKSQRRKSSVSLRQAFKDRLSLITVERCFIAMFPPASVHQNHPMDGMYPFPMNKHIRQKIADLVSSGLSHGPDIRRQLAFYVQQELFAGKSVPPKTDTRYWPSSRTILQYVFRLKKKAKTESSVQNMVTIESINLDNQSRLLQINWKEAGSSTSTSSYPYLWLRDSCCCDACFDMSTQSPKWTFDQLDVNCEPVVAELSRLENEIVDDVISLTWDDGHLTVFTGSTLRQCQFRDEIMLRPSEHQLWGSEMQDRVPRFFFKKLLTDDKTLYDWITTLWVTGICVVVQAPSEPGQLEAIASRVAFLRPTHYGSTFDVHTKQDPSNLAYTTGPLGMHTDLAYNNYVPGMQMLHCLAQTKTDGGENQFSDGFLAARQLRSRHPEHFQLLSTVPVDFYDVGTDFIPFFQRSTHQTIKLNEQDEVVQVTFSNHSRDRLQLPSRLKIDQVEPFYRALRTFYGLLYAPENLIQFKLNEGDIVCFHNFRVLHARSAFSLSNDGGQTQGYERHLIGGYIDWNEMLSKRRVLRRQLNIVDGSVDF